ncbi:DNA repair and recombination protein RadB [Candidatus Woesearchaeota archaeon]|nr:MAG: DNA repair and recombination protein RadB [Candidatus Woesearchaeota archaeon]
MINKRIPTGTKILDKLLEGGYETDAVTTIYGPAGSGKTNIAILAAIETAKTGKKVIYIDTEGGFSITRLKQIMPEYKKIINNIIFIKPTRFEDQIKAIKQLKEMTSQNIGLIIIDTITMLYRLQRSFKEDDTHNQELSKQMLTLNEIARTKKIPILILSQVYQSFETNKTKPVGGDILTYASKCLLELDILNNGNRRIQLKKHRSIGGEKEEIFKIIEKGIKNAYSS